MSAATQWRILLGAAVTVAIICVGVYMNRNNKRLDRQATALLAEAQAVMTPASTPEDARAWLEANDWFIARNERGDWVAAFYPRNAGPFDPPEYLIVRAYKRLEMAPFIPGERWISLHYRFTPERTFTNLYLDRRAPRPQGWREPPTTRE